MTMMIPNFNYALMQILCEELRERILNFKVIGCFSHDLSRFFLILCRQKHQETLFFCFSPPFLRFHLIQLSPPSSHPHSSHPLSSFLRGATLKDVSLLQHDRILQLTFLTSQGEQRLIAEFFNKHPNYYLIQSDNTILFALHPHPQTHYQLPPSRHFPLEPSFWLNHQEVEQAYTEIEKHWELTREKQALQKQLSKQFKKLKRKEKELLKNLEECSHWRNIQHEGDLIKCHLDSIKKGSSFLIVHDWMTDQPYHLQLNPAKTPQEEMMGRFKQAKKLQKGEIPLTQYLEHIRKELHNLNQQQQTLNLIKTPKELASFKKTFFFHPSPPSPSPPLPSLSLIYREYQSSTGMQIWVGKNAKANDRLTFQLANGRDWWLHARECSGSHVIIRLGKHQEPDPETLKDALQLALYYSRARAQGEGEICWTQRKYVSRLGKRKAGLVQISKHQTAWIRSDPARLQALKERKQ